MSRIQRYITLNIVTLMTLLATPAFLVTAYISDSALQASPSTRLSSKVIFESPSMENIYKELIVSSKPLHLRKYSSRPKTKQSKKDSRIFFIPMPPLPYRFIPGIGYDYQPMKIQPLFVDPEVAVTTQSPKKYSDYKIPNPYKQYQQQLAAMSHFNPLKTKPQGYKTSSTESPSRKSQKAESKTFHLDRGDYYFNGRPFRLHAAHAGPTKHNLTPQNLKSSFYLNKNIIY